VINFARAGAPSCAPGNDACMTSRELSGEYWFCMKHHRVEKYEDTDSSNRIGPFKSEREAADALQTISDREKAYDKSDSDWDDEQ
jgi:hypothetical protein